MARYRQTTKLTRGVNGRVKRTAQLVLERRPVGQAYDAIAADECCSICGYLACADTCIADSPVPDKLPPGWHADARESGLWRHASDRNVAVAETNCTGDFAWRFWTGGERSFTGHAPTRAKAMARALGFEVFKTADERFHWERGQDESCCRAGAKTLASAELAALDALAWDAQQRCAQ